RVCAQYAVNICPDSDRISSEQSSKNRRRKVAAVSLEGGSNTVFRRGDEARYHDNPAVAGIICQPLIDFCLRPEPIDTNLIAARSHDQNRSRVDPGCRVPASREMPVQQWRGPSPAIAGYELLDLL